MNVKVSVISPAYNEEENIPYLVEEFDKFKNLYNIDDWELIIVDDGSIDKTYLVSIEYAKDRRDIKVIRLIYNKGKTHAIKEGLKYSSGKIIIIFDADLQFSFEDCLNIVKKIEEGWDLVAGYKVGKYEKKLVSYIYNFLARVFFGVKVRDMNALKGMRREVLEIIPLLKEWHRYIIPIAHHYKFKITEIPVKLYPRRAGQSKYRGKLRILVGLFDLLSVKFLLTFKEKPLLLFGTIGFLFLFLGIIIGIVAVILRFYFDMGYRPLVYLVILLILSGLLLISMGFIAELLVYYEENRRK
ncbi:MAG: glycosyltransferase family 2 protein [candidate division WOR-3 bacterium]|nr:glycosyltransferase family 2 protein [candidate division WOR-3 bacterium]MCX7947455.1 glycosyltransferase family 2 protein [candidate division WOR-3 bacterium]MDW8150614.1 glycosyltransferase family 2 protein [candidate division WOR-3 bacterium]